MIYSSRERDYSICLVRLIKSNDKPPNIINILKTNPAVLLKASIGFNGRKSKPTILNITAMNPIKKMTKPTKDQISCFIIL